MATSEAGRGLVAVARKIPIVYWACVTLLAAATVGIKIGVSWGAQAQLPQMVSTLAAQVAAKDSVLNARIDSTNLALVHYRADLATIKGEVKMTRCYVVALWASNEKPNCGLDGER